MKHSVYVAGATLCGTGAYRDIHDNVRYKQERDIPYFSLRRGCFCRSRLVRAHTVRMTGSMKEV